MKEIETQIVIQATPAKSWEVLMDFNHFPAWNPFIKSISGNQRVGATLEVFIQPPGMSGLKLKPMVLKCEPPKEFRWKGKFLTGGIFDGEHHFILEDLGNNTSKFIHGEKFTGILVGFVSGMLAKTKLGFEAMNEALKQRAESREHRDA